MEVTACLRPTEFANRREPTPRSESVLRQDLRRMIADGASFSVMVGIGETYLPAFALMVGTGEVAAGLVAVVPMLAGAVLQLAAPRGVRRLGSDRRWVVLCAICQAASLLVLPAALLLPRFASPLVFAAATIYWAANLATGPVWNTWVEGLVPRRVRARFFARRVWFSQAGIFAGFVLGGLALQSGSKLDRTGQAFVALFVLGAVCRFISAWHLNRQSEPDERGLEVRRVGFAEFARRARSDADGRLLIYLLSVQVAVQIAGPYFTPYMLRHLELSYLDYMLLIAVAFAGKVVSLPLLGRMAKRLGPRRLLWFGGLGIVPLSGLWLVSNSYAFLMGLQVFGGVVWAAYELAVFLMFFETIPREDRTGLLTLFNFGNALAMVVGAMIGGATLSLLGEGSQSYLTLFGLSSLARVATIGLLAGIPAAVHAAVSTTTRTIAVRPSAGTIERPILPSLISARAEAPKGPVREEDPDHRLNNLTSGWPVSVQGMPTSASCQEPVESI